MARLLLVVLAAGCAACAAAGPPGADDAGAADAGTSDAVRRLAPEPTCARECASAADCSVGMATSDDDNWRCDEGACVYLGCNSDDECRADDMSSTWTECRALPGETPGCVTACASPADCAQAGALFDEDNYECREGGCVHKGCLDDDECGDLSPVIGFACADLGPGPPACVPRCRVPSDCVQGDFDDEDNWLCAQGACQRRGCDDDDACGEGLVCVAP